MQSLREDVHQAERKEIKDVNHHRFNRGSDMNKEMQDGNH